MNENNNENNSENQNHNECPICLSNARFPVVTKCGHLFCWECIKNYVKVKRISECPMCKNGIKLDEVVKIFNGAPEIKGANDNRPNQADNNPEDANCGPNIGQRILNNFGYYGYTKNTSYRPPNEEEQKRFRYSWAIVIIIIAFIIYIFK